MTKSIPLTQGQFALVDDEDFEFLNQWKWHALYTDSTKSFYAERGGNHIMMHRELMRAPGNMQVDHIDRNTLNNQKNNLRLCTSSQNAKNRKVQIDSKSGYKGVTAHLKRWRATIKFNKKQLHLGVFDTPEEAARAYDKSAKENHGDFAWLNFK